VGLKDIVAKSVATAFTAIGDLKITLEYHSVTGSSTWNSNTGEVSVTEVVVPNVPGIMGKFDEQELLTQFSQVGSYVDPSGQKMSAAKLIIETPKLGNVTPAKDDFFFINGTKWHVVQIESPVRNFIWKLAVRAEVWKPKIQ